MVTRKRLRSFFTALGLYAIAALVIGYFAVNAFSGNHGLRAQQQLEEQIAELTAEFGRAELERQQWERRVSLLRSDRLDPDLLDERARAELHYMHPREVTFNLKPR
ncbi:MAG TPA: septum formation initiator family protein [Xanthobacteraceae bacterium]|nr:septum formation initiator family protein [Xanthobacteraceae bacterium]